MRGAFRITLTIGARFKGSWDMAKNYYVILGISPGATLDEIKSAYRRRAREYHPDRFGEDSRPFLDVQEAYAVLSSPAHRAAFDRGLRDVRRYGVAESGPEPLRSRRPAAEPLRQAGQPADLGGASLLDSFRTHLPSFDEVFDRLWRNFANVARPKGEMLENLNVEFLLTPDQARRGGHVRVHVPAQATCPTCNGQGGIGGYECWHCAGEGCIAGEYPMTIAFPPGVYDGFEVAVPLDHMGIRNLYLTLHFRISRDAGDEDI